MHTCTSGSLYQKIIVIVDRILSAGMFVIVQPPFLITIIIIFNNGKMSGKSKLHTNTQHEVSGKYPTDK